MKNSLRTQIIFATVLTLILGCTGPDINAMPLWVSTPSSDSAHYLYGVGSGPDYNSARDQALSDLASRFNSNVSAVTKTHDRQVNGKVDSSYENKVMVRVESTKLTHYKVTRSEQVGMLVWSEIALDRMAFSNDLKEEWHYEDKLLKDAVTRLEALPLIQQITGLKDAHTHMEKSQGIMAQLSVASRSWESKAILDRYARYQTEFKKIIDKAEITIISDKKGDFAATLLQGNLSKFGIRSQVYAKLKPQELAGDQIHIVTTSTTKSDGDATKVKLEVRFESRDNKGKVVGQSRYFLNGRSYDGEQAAYQQASAKLKLKFKRMTLTKVLGLE